MTKRAPGYLAVAGYVTSPDKRFVSAYAQDSVQNSLNLRMNTKMMFQTPDKFINLYEGTTIYSYTQSFSGHMALGTTINQLDTTGNECSFSFSLPLPVAVIKTITAPPVKISPTATIPTTSDPVLPPSVTIVSPPPTITPPTLTPKPTLPVDFNVTLYKTLNGDLQSLSDDDAKNHYLQFGMKEGRSYKAPPPPPVVLVKPTTTTDSNSTTYIMIGGCILGGYLLMKK